MGFVQTNYPDGDPSTVVIALAVIILVVHTRTQAQSQTRTHTHAYKIIHFLNLNMYTLFGAIFLIFSSISIFALFSKQATVKRRCRHRLRRLTVNFFFTRRRRLDFKAAPVNYDLHFRYLIQDIIKITLPPNLYENDFKTNANTFYMHVH